VTFLSHAEVRSALACPVVVREREAASCQHFNVRRQKRHGYTVVICVCGHHWTEWPLNVRLP
jgi:hypothetical protein